jgi:DNA-binding GntR family transcriptional regulator
MSDLMIGHGFAEEEAPRTLAELVYRKVRSDILWGRLAPGSPLRSDQLRIKYDAGISPLREALSRLVSERLVVASGQRGFRVAPIGSSDVVDVIETRIVIETAALKLSIERGGLDWETGIVATHHALSRVPIPKMPGPGAELWMQRHRAFHLALLSACGSNWQLHLSALLFDQAERFRILRAVASLTDEAQRDPAKEHQQIVEAVLDRDFGRAAAALESHYRSTMRSALAAIDNSSKSNA